MAIILSTQPFQSQSSNLRICLLCCCTIHHIFFLAGPPPTVGIVRVKTLVKCCVDEQVFKSVVQYLELKVTRVSLVDTACYRRLLVSLYTHCPSMYIMYLNLVSLIDLIQIPIQNSSVRKFFKTNLHRVIRCTNLCDHF